MKKEDLRIVFLGTPEFAVESLSRIVDAGYNVVGVVTMPDKIAGRGHKLISSAVKQYAVANGLHLMQPEKLKAPEFVEELRSLRANLFVVIAFRMLPEVVWSMPELGTFNLHASLLPRYRGAAPINRAVMNGDTETGVTTFFLKQAIDTGDVLRQERIEIGPDEDAGSVHDRLMMLGADVTMDTIAHIVAGDLTQVPQDQLLQGEEPTAAPKIFKETCRMDWTLGAAALHNHVRGLSPYPAAWTVLKEPDGKETELMVFATKLTDEATALPAGTLLPDSRRMAVATSDGRVLEVLSVRPAGRKRMDAPDFLRGARLPEGTSFV
ncbi:MAG: methionyl-tRNA formyltransferase [Muribaculaceae bacterium]|nr:methionyl-tRNA formyltransferase [Muribaculaceae bacterium]